MHRFGRHPVINPAAAPSRRPRCGAEDGSVRRIADPQDVQAAATNAGAIPSLPRHQDLRDGAGSGDDRRDCRILHDSDTIKPTPLNASGSNVVASLAVRWDALPQTIDGDAALRSPHVVSIGDDGR